MGMTLEYSHYQARLEGMMVAVKRQIVEYLLKSDNLESQKKAAILDALSHADFVDYACTIVDPTLEPLLVELRRIDAALCQCDIGLYGICSDCEEQIETHRLTKDPCVQRCENCEKKRQMQKRQDLFAL